MYPDGADVVHYFDNPNRSMQLNMHMSHDS